MSRAVLRGAVAGTVLAVAVATAGIAAAAYGDDASSGSTISTATLAPPSSLAVSVGCNGLLAAKATLTWTATPSSFAAGYVVERVRLGAVESTATVTPRTTTSFVDTGLSVATQYTWRVRASAHSWRSTVVSVTATTPLLC